MKKIVWKNILLLVTILFFVTGISAEASTWPPYAGQEMFYLDTEEHDKAIFEPATLNPDTFKEDSEKILFNDVEYIYTKNAENGYDKVEIVGEDTLDKEGKAWFYHEISSEDGTFSSVEGSGFSWGIYVAQGNPNPQFEIDFSCIMTWYRDIKFTLPDLNDASVSYSNGSKGTINAVINTYINEIDSYRVPVTLEGEVLDPDTYRVTVRKEGDKYFLRGFETNGVYYQDAPDYFADRNIRIEINPLEKCPLDSQNLDIFVNDVSCNFASEEDMTPQVEIRLGTSILKEGIDYRLEYYYPGTISQKGRIKIFALDTSESIQGPEMGTYITRAFMCHQANINDYYTLEGLPDELLFYGSQDPFLLNKSGKGDYTENKLISEQAVYLKPIPGKIISWQLPRIKSSGKVDKQLYDGSYYLEISYSLDGVHYSGHFDYSGSGADKALKEGKAYVKVSVSRIGNQYNNTPNEYDREDCYLDGSIIKEIPFVARSLDEINPDNYPATQPDANDSYVMAFLNTIQTDSIYGNHLPEYKESPLQDAVYTGQEQKPALNAGIFSYPLPALGAPPALIPGIISYPIDAKYIKSIVYSDNVNADTGKVTVNFQGGFTGSVTRTFKISPADISNFEVKILEDPAYTGKLALPKVQVSSGNKILAENVDYKVSLASDFDGITPGSQNAEIIGIGNYKGSIFKDYNIQSGILSDDRLVEIQVSNITYSGMEVLPKVIVKDIVQDKILTEGNDYEISLDNTADNVNAGQGRVIISGKNQFDNSIVIKEYSILPKNINLQNTVDIMLGEAFYTGQPVLPPAIVTDKERRVVLVERKDYVIQVSSNVNVGTGKAEIWGIGNYTGSSEIDFKIVSSNLPQIENIPDMNYTGSKVEPEVVIPGLSKNVDYTISYKNNLDAGTALAIATFKKNYHGTVIRSFTILPKNFDTGIQIDLSNAVYNGRPVLPQAVVRDTLLNRTLIENVDYRINSKPGESNIEIGQGKAVITGIGNYQGSRSMNFSVVAPENSKGELFVVMQRQENSLKLYWNKQEKVSGYQIYMSTKKNGKYRKVLTTTKNRGRIAKLKHSRVYYFKRRTYTRKNGSYIYGKFSQPMAIGTSLKKPEISLSHTKKTVKVTINQIPNASGYRIWMKTSADGEWKSIKNITKYNRKKKIVYSIKNLKKEKIIYIKVRGYRMISGNKLYSPRSVVRKIKI